MMKRILYRNIILTTALAVLLASPAIVASARVSKGTATSSSSSGSTLGPESGNVVTARPPTQNETPSDSGKDSTVPKSNVSGNAIDTESENSLYDEFPVINPANTGTIDSDGNAIVDGNKVNSVTNITTDSDKSTDGVPVTEETRDADTNKDGRVTNAELNNAANGGDIHSTHR